MKNRRTLAALKADPRITEVWEEKDDCWADIRGGRAYWATLAEGYCTDADTSTLHEPTVKRLWKALDAVQVREGPAPELGAPTAGGVA